MLVTAGKVRIEEYPREVTYADVTVIEQVDGPFQADADVGTAERPFETSGLCQYLT